MEKIVFRRWPRFQLIDGLNPEPHYFFTVAERESFLIQFYHINYLLGVRSLTSVVIHLAVPAGFEPAHTRLTVEANTLLVTVHYKISNWSGKPVIAPAPSGPRPGVLLLYHSPENTRPLPSTCVRARFNGQKHYRIPDCSARGGPGFFGRNKTICISDFRYSKPML